MAGGGAGHGTGSPAGLGAEAAAVAAAVAAVLLASAVWAGAQAAALVFGAHRALPAGLADALRAVPRLAAHPGRPATAWPPAAASALPGAAAYWLCTGPAVAVAVAVAAGALVVAGRLRGGPGLERRRRLGIDPHAGMARGRDLAPLWVSGPRPGRVILGRAGRRLVATEDRTVGLDRVPFWLRVRAERRRGDRGAVLVVGPSRCGKTATLAVPAILEWDGPVIALSVKSDLMDATIAARRKLGKVQVFDPSDATWEKSDSWSPLRSATTLSGAMAAAHELANATDWSKANGDMRFWADNAEALLAPLMWLARLQSHTMGVVAGWVLGMDRPGPNGPGTVANLLDLAAQHPAERIRRDAVRARQLLDGCWVLEFKQLSSVYITAKAMVGAWLDETVEASSVGEPVSLGWLLDDGPKHDERRALYLCAPLKEAERLAPVLAGALSDLIGQAYELVGKDSEPIGPVLVVVDEAGNWPIQDLPQVASTCAGIGLQLIVVFQSKAQIDAAYGTQADTVISNCLTKVFFTGLSDESSLRYASLLLGGEWVTQRQTSVDLDGRGGRSVTESLARTELVPIDKLRQMEPGHALLVHNTLPPAHLRGRWWFKEPQWRELAAEVDARRAQRVAERAAERAAGRVEEGAAARVPAGGEAAPGASQPDRPEVWAAEASDRDVPSGGQAA